MNVRCPTCDTVYRVDPVKVPAAGTRARCGVCAGIIPVLANGTSASARAPSNAVPTLAPIAAPPPVLPEPVAVPAEPSPPPAAAPKAPTPTRRVTAPFFQPRRSETTSASPAAPVARAVPAPPAAPARPSAPVFKPTPGSPVTRPTEPSQAPPAAVTPAPVAAPPAAPPAPPTPAGGGFVNPFLAQDPRQKARRLARALVSDMIVYQPAKRQEALAAGNVKEAFDEEVKKSWEEYVDQIGEEIATSTPYWTEALNDILAGGQQLF